MIVSRSNFDFVLSVLAGSPRLGLDSETTGLSEEDRPFSIIMADATDEYYFNFQQYPTVAEEFILGDEHKQKLKDFFTDTTKTYYISNAKFDMRMLGYEGIEIKGTVFCTNQMGRLLRNDHITGYGLDVSCQRIGYGKDKTVDIYIQKNKLYRTDKHGDKQPCFDKVPFDIITKYGEKDARLHYILGEYLREKLSNYPELQSQIETEQNLTKTVFAMERTGIRVDTLYIRDAIDYEERLIRESMESFLALTGYEYDNKKSTLLNVFAKAGVKIPLTEKGNPSITDDVLEEIDGEVATTIRDIRSREKKIATFYTNFLRFADRDGIIHPDFVPSGTVTGRFSCRNPNVQQLAKEEGSDEAFLVRGCFIPRPGKVFVSIDYKAQEMRLLADYAGDSRLVATIMSGKDVHQATADLAGISRSHAKTVAFSCIGEDQLVLTDKGLVKIQDVMIEHLIWDGLEFVPHAGVVYSGVKKTITVQGLRATPDHVVFTDTGRQVYAWEAADEQRNNKIAITEIDGKEIRVSFDTSEDIRSREEAPKNSGSLLTVLKDIYYRYWKYPQRKDNQLPLPESVYSYGRGDDKKDSCNKKTHEAVLGSKLAMHESEVKELEILWWARNTGKNIRRRLYKFLYEKLLGRGDPNTERGQNKQRGSLRDGEYSSGDYEGKQSKYQEKYREEKTYDILNCGPRNRFTVSGKLVHNCLYGSGVPKLARTLGSSEQVAKEIRKKFFIGLPYVEHLISEVKRRALHSGFIKTFTGRRLHLSDPKYSYIMPNHLIQGCAAETMRIALNRVGKYLEDKESRMLLTIHDEIILEMPESELHLVTAVQAIMESVYVGKNGITLETEAKISRKSLAIRDMEKYELPHLHS